MSSQEHEKKSEAGRKGGEDRWGENETGGSRGDTSGGGRGLANASEETRERVARAGGEAPHQERGLQAADEETRERVARAGGEAHLGSSNTGGNKGDGKGFAGMSEEEREHAAEKGGED